MTIAHRISRSLDGITSKKGLQRLAILGIIILVLAAAVGLYHWYSVRQMESAQNDLAACFEELEKARHSFEEHDWQEVAGSCAAGFQKHATSSMAPYFLALEAEALYHLNRAAEAHEKMNEALKKFSSKSPVYYLYALKRALMMIDSAETAIHDEGLKALQELADCAKNPQQDMALFYVGHDYFMRQDMDNATKMWTQLMQQFGNSSVWAMKAQRYLETLSSENK